MKNIFKSSKTRKSIIGAALAAISLFTFNFTPISIISSKIASASIYEATETKITENTSSTQIQATELVSNLKEYFSESNLELNLSDYYKSEYENLILTKTEEYLISVMGEQNYKSNLGSNATLKDYFETSTATVLEFIMRFVNTLSIYSSYPSIDATNKEFTKLSVFYTGLDNFLNSTTNSINSQSQDGITENTTEFYADSISYKSAKKALDEIIMKKIAIVSYDGTENNKVAAIIANNAPTKTPYKYGSTYQTHKKPYFDKSSSPVTVDTIKTSPFDYMKDGDNYYLLNTYPYETNTNGSLVVYVAVEDEVSASMQATYDFLGYKTISRSEILADNSDGNFDTYYPVRYSTNEKYYFEFLYNELVSSNKINDTITFEKFTELFYQTTGANVSESILFVKFSSNAYRNKLFVSSDDYAKLQSSYQGYDYFNYVSVFDSINMKDFVKVSDTTLDSTYKISSVSDITLYFKNEIIKYTDDTIVYLTNDDGSFIYETELTLDLAYEKTSGKNNIYVLDESENASENEIYKSLGYTVIDSPTIDYVEIKEDDDNYSEDYKLYYKYANSNDVFAKNLLTLSSGETPVAKNAVYILSSSVESNLTEICKMNSFIPLSKDDLTNGYFAKVNKGDPIYSSEYELYYKYNTSVYSKTDNKIYQYTSSSESEFNGFYKTDDGYNLDDYVKITKDDPNFKQGYDLYYKKTTKTESTDVDKNVTYSITTKSTSGIKFTANSYYAISFYVNTSGENVSASLELEDSNNILSDTKITGISTNGEWVKYYLFIATSTLTDSSVKLVMSMGTKDGITNSETITSLTGSVLFDEVKIYKINETDFNKKTINNENVYVDVDGSKVDSTQNKHEVNFNNSFNANEKYQNNLAVNGWNNIFDFETIDTSILSNSQEYGGNLQNINIDNIDGYTNTFDETDENDLWHYYIGRDVSGKNNSELLEAYRKAYKDFKVNISLPLESDEKSPETNTETEALADDDSTEDSDKSDDEEIEINPIISNTFVNNNKVLKIENTSASMPLGVVSKPFTINNSDCYKISLWIYSPNEKSTATIKIISNILTAQSDEYGKELSAGASDICAYLEEDDDKSTNEYRWLPVEFYVQGNVLKDQKCNLVLLADENSTVYFDNIKVEKITTKVYSDAKTSDARTYKLSLTDSNATLSKNITNGFFNDSSVTDIKQENYLPKTAQSWTITTDAAQDYVKAGVISSKNTEFIENFNDGKIINNTLATNMYTINVEDEKFANHKIYSSKITLDKNSVYKITFEYYYSDNNFSGDIISNLYYSSYSADNKISAIKATAQNADGWNSVTFYIATSTSSVSAILELGVECAAGTIFFRNVYATTITKTLDEIRVANSTNTDGKLTINNNHIAIVDFATNSFTINKEANDDGIIESSEFKTNSTNTDSATSGKTGVIIAEYFTETKSTEKTVTIDDNTYYVYDNDGTLELYKYPVYANTSLENNEKLTQINKKSFVIENNKVIVGTGSNQEEYDIVEKFSSKLNYTFENDAVIGNTTIAASELNNSQSQNVLILANSNETDYTEIESNYSMSLAASSYYAIKFYVKTSDFESDDFGLSIIVSATNLNINWNEDLINTTEVSSTMHKDSNGFVCYQLLIDTQSSSYSDLKVKFSLGTASNTDKGYAIISKVELTTISSEDEFKHYSEIFADEEDDSIIKNTSGTKSSNSSSNLSSTSEVTWATFFYIFSSLLLFIVLLIAMIAIVFKKHPIHKKAKVENENYDVDSAAKTKEKITNEQDKKSEGGIE